MKKVSALTICIRLIFAAAFLTAIPCFSQTEAMPEQALKLTFVGDTMAHDVNFRIKDFSVIYTGIKDILLADDLTFSNLEAPVDESIPYKSYPCFNMHRDYARAGIDAGIDVYALANNHSLDQGDQGIFGTLGSMFLLREEKKLNFYFSGTRGSLNEEYTPIEIRKNGFRIGYIAVTQFLNGYVQSPYIHIVNYDNEKQADNFLQFVKKVSGDYDLFIISFHAGGEYKLLPEQEKTDYFRKLVNAGADIIYGHHPHVLQPYEIIETDTGARKLIMYSMGNFISGQRWTDQPYELEHYRSYTGDSLILKVDIAKTAEGPTLKAIAPVLITNHINENRETIIDTYDHVMTLPLDKKWETYYRERYKILSRLVAGYGSVSRASDVTK